jgi:hypothetical protein
MRSHARLALGMVCLAFGLAPLGCKSTDMGGFINGGASGSVGGSGGSNNDAAPKTDVGGGSDAVSASPGCGMAAPTDPPQVADNHNYQEFTISVSATTMSSFATSSPSSFNRLYYVRLPDNYDPTKPYRVIYLGPGCGAAQDISPTSRKGLPFDTDSIATDAKSNAILVQMEQGFYNPATYNSTSCVPNGGGTSTTACQYCFDDWADIAAANPIPDSLDKVAMEKAYFDALHKQIEATYCVDKNREFFTGYSSGGWLAQQLGCWFPDVLRAQGNVTGGLPPVLVTNTLGTTAPNDYCVQHPIAAFLLHNSPDQSNAFQGSVNGAQRLFALNGCTGSFSAPPTPTQAIPDGLEEYTITGVPNTNSFRCVRYTTCPADAPIVFCVSTDSLHTDTQAVRAVPGFWEFFSQF